MDLTDAEYQDFLARISCNIWATPLKSGQRKKRAGREWRFGRKMVGRPGFLPTSRVGEVYSVACRLW